MRNVFLFFRMRNVKVGRETSRAEKQRLLILIPLGKFARKDLGSA